MQTLYIIYDPKNEKVLYKTYDETKARDKMTTYIKKESKPIVIRINKNEIKSNSFYILYDITHSKVISIKKYPYEILNYIKNTKKYCLNNYQVIEVNLRKES